MTEGATYDATLQALPSRFGGRRGKKQKKTLRRIVCLYGIAFTVLDCIPCGHRVYLEAHHSYGTGKPRRLSKRRKGKRDKEYRAFRAKVLRRKQLFCPKCGLESWRYVRTEVSDAGAASRLYSEVSP